MKIEEKIKGLTTKQCIEIAKIINPDINWVENLTSSVWDGFDLVDENIIKFKHYIQIDYRTDEKLKILGVKRRFRYFVDFDEEIIEQDKLFKIFNYLQNI